MQRAAYIGKAIIADSTICLIIGIYNSQSGDTSLTRATILGFQIRNISMKFAISIVVAPQLKWLLIVCNLWI